MLKPDPTLQWIFWRWGERHPDRQPGFRSAVVEAMREIARCGTGALGWREYVCPEHGGELVPNTCRRRDCPMCISDRAWRWSCAMESRLLDCPHFHVVFTLSSVLNPIFRHNRSAFADVLFEASAAALRRLLADPNHMGGRSAMLAVLHTHGGALPVHLHTHFVVSSVGLAPDGTLVRCKRPMLLPFRALRRAFQMEFLHRLAALADSPDFHFPKGTTAPEFRLLLARLFGESQARWNVRVFRRDDIRPVIRYLSRTVYGGPLRNDRIRAVTADEVVFAYQDWRGREEGSGTAPLRELRIGIDDFVNRWSEHVHEPGFKTVRHFGLFAPGNRNALDAARLLLSQAPLPAEPSATDEPPEVLVRCRHCQRPMTHRELAPTQVIYSPAAQRLLRARDSPFLRWENAA